jgi:hypothetical protein
MRWTRAVTHVKNWKCVNIKKIYLLEVAGVDGILLKQILTGKVQTGFIWL